MGALGTFLLLRVALVAMLVLSAPVAATDAKSTAVISISGPEEVHLEAGDATTFQLHLSSRLQCASGFAPPRDLLVLPSHVQPGGDDRPWRLDPPSVQVPWEASPAEPNVYVVDELVTFNVTSSGSPEAPVSSPADLLVQEVQDRRPSLRCQVDGYELQVEPFHLVFVVAPPGTDADTAAALPDDAPPVRWVPMLLAVGILAALAGFATLRERQRRRR